MANNLNKNKTDKNFTATLAHLVCVAVILFIFTSCGNNKGERITLNSLEDTLAYCSGSLQKVQYNFFIESNCRVDSTYRPSCFEGIEKGYNDSVSNIAYYDGISIGIQALTYFVSADKHLQSPRFIDGMLDGAFKDEKLISSEAKEDTIYAKGILHSRLLKEYLSNLNYAGDTLKQFVEGFKEGSSSVGYPERYARACGKVFGGSRLRGAFKKLNFQIFGEDKTKSLSPDLFFAGFMDCNSPDALIPHKDANEISVLSDLKIKDALYSDNKTRGEEFLEENKKKSGIVTLDNGIQYKIIKKGKGRIPGEEDIVDVHYVGKTLDGTIFTDTHGYTTPVPMSVKDANECYRDVLKMMPEGSVWEIYVPQNLAFGSMQTKFFKPFSTLIYEIELVKIKK